MVKKLVKKSAFAEMAGVSNAAITKACKPGAALAATVVGRNIDANHPDAVDYLQRQAENAAAAPATGLDPRYEEAVQWCTDAGKWTAYGLHKGIGISRTRADKIIAMAHAAGLVPEKGRSTPAALAPVKKAPPPPPPALQEPRRIVSGQAARRVTKKDEALEQLSADPTIHEVPENIEAFADMSLRELIQRFGTDAAFVDWLRATKMIEDINDKRVKNAEARGELVSRRLVKVAIIDPIDAAHTKLLTDGAKTIARRIAAMLGADRSLEDCEEFAKDQIASFIRPVKAKVARTVKELGE